MNFKRILIPALALVAFYLAWRDYGFPGIALVAGALLMWALLHFNRMMQVMRRAANRPVGHVDSAVMLNAKLKPGVNLLHVLAMTRALGLLRSPKDEQPEIYRWTDQGGSYVDCTFQDGKLVQWQMTRPTPAAEASDAPPAAP